MCVASCSLLAAALQRVSSEHADVKRRLGEEQGRREQLEQIAALLRQQLTTVTAEAEAGAATIAKLKVLYPKLVCSPCSHALSEGLLRF